MDSSFDMMNESSYLPLPRYPPLPVSSFTPMSFRSMSDVTSTDDSHLTSLTSTCTPIVYTYSSSLHSNMAGDQLPMNRCVWNENPSAIYSSNVVISRSDDCLVCSDRASGIHFGVSTCEACKAFFRRANLSSPFNQRPCSPIRCEINPKNRNDCPGCRFDKCKHVGMARENVVFGKPSKQQINIHHSSNDYIQKLTETFEQLIELLRQIDSIYQSNGQISVQANHFGLIVQKLFYDQSFHIDNINWLNVIGQIFHCYKKSVLSDYFFLNKIHLYTLLTLWLSVYYYETFFLKQSISQEKIILLIKLLDMQLEKEIIYNNEDQASCKNFRIDFINTFTKFADLVQQFHIDD